MRHAGFVAVLAGLTLVLADGGVTWAAVPAQDADRRGADPGVLFWTPERREADFRRMAEVTPSRVVARGGPVRDLPQGPSLDLDVEAFMASERTAGLLVLQNGRVRLERYGLGMTPDDPWVSFSVTKSLISILYGAALAEGAIADLDDPVTAYAPELAGGGYDGVTVRQLLTMTSGVAWNEDYTDPDSDVARMLAVEPEPGLDATISYMRGLARAHAPGTRWRYSTGETNLAGVVLSRAVGRPLADYLSETVWARAGMERDATWALDAQGAEIGGCCVSATLRDWGRVGLLALEDGVAGGARVTAEGWFAEATRAHADIGLPGRGYGYQWWTFDDGAFSASGIFGQTLYVDRSRGLVVAILSAWPTATGAERSAARTALLDAVKAAVDAEGP